MTVVRTSISIERPQPQVFDCLADLARHREWDTSLLKTQVLDEGPFREGIKAVEVRKMMGREMRITYAITRNEPPERYDFRTLDGPVHLVGIMRCAEERGTTVVSYEYTLTGILAPLMAMNVRRASERNLASLKRVLEAEAVAN